MNSSDMMFIIPLSYSEREKEIFFLKDLLNKFDKDSLVVMFLLVIIFII